MNLNSEQMRAVESSHKDILVVANAGSGKTSTFVHRIRHLIKHGTRPDSIIAITFTNAAAREIVLRLQVESDKDYARMLAMGHTDREARICTPPKLGYVGTLHGFVLRQLQRYGADAIGISPKLTVMDETENEALVARCVTRLNYRGPGKAVEEAIMLGLERYRTGKFKRSEAAELVAYEYYFQMITTGALSFDSILQLGVELFKQPGVTAALRQYDHLLVDEYQDSGELDETLYELIPATHRFFVGDPDQSIYSFRGGCQHLIMMRSGMDHVECLPLSVNYRSAVSICRVANALIGRNVRRLPKDLISHSSEAGEFNLRTYDSDAEEIAGVAQDVKMLIDGGEEPGEVAVLCRSNYMAGEFRAALKARYIPVHGKVKMELPPDWVAARAFLNLLANPENDNVAFRFMVLKLGEAEAEAKRKAATDSYQSINERWLHIEDIQLDDVPTIMVQAGIGRESVARVSDHRKALPPEATLLELMFSLNQKESGIEEHGEGVTVTTIHAAKGREFNTVLLPGIEEAMFPGRDDVEESRRLLFVGMTRARRILIMSCAGKRHDRWHKGQMVKATRSRFLSEISLP